MLVKKEIKVVPIRENHHSNKTVIDLDDALFDSIEEKEAYYRNLNEDGEMEFPEEYYKNDWNDTPAAEDEEKIPTM